MKKSKAQSSGISEVSGLVVMASLSQCCDIVGRYHAAEAMITP